jgi:hypothetical protein
MHWTYVILIYNLMITYIQKDPGGYLYDETYFLINELFVGFEIRFFNKEEMFNYEFLLSQTIIFTSNLIEYEDIEKLCLTIKPKIIVQDQNIVSLVTYVIYI